MEVVVAVVHGTGFDVGLARDKEELQWVGVGSAAFLALGYIAKNKLVDFVAEFGREW